MTHILSRAHPRLSALIVGSVIALAFAAPAHAAGSSMPWEAPLQAILESIQGPVAKIVAVIIIIATGLALAFGDTSGGFRRLTMSGSRWSPRPLRCGTKSQRLPPRSCGWSRRSSRDAILPA